MSLPICRCAVWTLFSDKISSSDLLIKGIPTQTITLIQHHLLYIFIHHAGYPPSIPKPPSIHPSLLSSHTNTFIYRALPFDINLLKSNPQLDKKCKLDPLHMNTTSFVSLRSELAGNM